jgi:hypothetical protein
MQDSYNFVWALRDDMFNFLAISSKHISRAQAIHSAYTI